MRINLNWLLNRLLFLPVWMIMFAVKAAVLDVDSKDWILGYWYNEEKTAIIEIAHDAKDETFFGKIVWLKEPLKNGKPKVDENNPKAELRSRELNGLQILSSFKFVQNKTWKHGMIYDPKNGKTYSCLLKINQDKSTELKVRGYIGIALLGRTAVWSKVEPEMIKTILQK